jgi:hypothetical protein
MEQRVNRVKFIGISYFILLSVVNFVATMLNGQLRALDFIIIFLAFTPLILNNKIVNFGFGILGVVISLYIGFACFMMNFLPNTNTSQFSFNMGYILSISSLIASSLLIYTSTNLFKPFKSGHV